MALIFSVLGLLLIASVASGVGRGNSWSYLGVRWDTNLLNFPIDLPQTTSDALKQGWQQYDSSCNGKGFKGYEGYAWMNALRDSAVTLLFDEQGYIAGIQVGIQSAEAVAKGYPSKKLKPPFVKASNDRSVLSAYFIEPSKICDTGRRADEFKSQGVGSELYIQNGQNSLKVPRTNVEMLPPWVQGECFVTKGLHYWYGVTEGTKCDEIFPVYVLYNGGELNAFGWAFTADMSSRYYEKTAKSDYNRLFKNVPTCLKDFESISTMTVYLTKRPSFNYC